MTKEIEKVNHPPHYGGKDNPYEAIKIIEAWGLGFHLGNALKYILRAGKKSDNKHQDLSKAIWYINRYDVKGAYDHVKIEDISTMYQINLVCNGVNVSSNIMIAVQSILMHLSVGSEYERGIYLDTVVNKINEEYRLC